MANKKIKSLNIGGAEIPVDGLITTNDVDDAILSERCCTYTVDAVSGATYGFALNADGYYESQNKGKASSYAICRVNLNVLKNCDIIFNVINNAEANSDFAVFGTLDKNMTLSNNTTTNVKETFKGRSSGSVVNVIYSNVTAGSHFIEIKFIKDGSVNSGNDSVQFKLIDKTSELRQTLNSALKVDTSGNSFVKGRIYTGTTTAHYNYQLLNRSEVESMVTTSVSSASTKLQSAIDKKLDSAVTELVYTGDPYGNIARFTVNSADDEIILVNNTNGEVYYYGVDINGNEFISCGFGCQAGERTTTTLNELYYNYNGSYMSDGPFELSFSLDYSIGDQGTVSFYAATRRLEAKDLITMPVIQEAEYATITKQYSNSSDTYRVVLTEANLKTGIFATAAQSQAHLYVTLLTPDGNLFAGNTSLADYSCYVHSGNKYNILECGILSHLHDYYPTEEEIRSGIVGHILEIYEYGYNDSDDLGLAKIEYQTSLEIKPSKQTLIEMEIEWEDEEMGTSIFKLIGVE